MEYDPERFIWLVGVAIRKNKQVTYQQFFAEKSSLDEERRILQSLIDLGQTKEFHLFVTYSGISADIPQLRKAWSRHSLPNSELSRLVKRHLDICYFLKNNFRFPMKSLGLDGMEEFLGIQTHSGISDGIEALALYMRYLRTKDKALKQQLLDYNREDIAATLTIVDRIPELISESLTVQ